MGGVWSLPDCIHNQHGSVFEKEGLYGMQIELQASELNNLYRSQMTLLVTHSGQPGSFGLIWHQAVFVFWAIMMALTWPYVISSICCCGVRKLRFVGIMIADMIEREPQMFSSRSGRRR